MTTIGDRIKSRREELGLTQDDLALKLGYKSRSSINKIEKDGRNLPQKKILDIALALDTTVAYIMGWHEPKVLDSIKDFPYPVGSIDIRGLLSLKNSFNVSICPFLNSFISKISFNKIL